MFIALIVCHLFTNTYSMEFTPYVFTEQYKCGEFLQHTLHDRTLDNYYSAVKQFITWISKPFPHAELLSDQALDGNLRELQNSLNTKYWQWFEWQQGWIVLCGIVLIISCIFPILYLFYRCCICCFCKASNKSSTDSRFDGCKRSILNTFLAFFVLIDLFAAATLLITGQYAQFGLEELPNRLNHCIDDLNLYRRDTDMRIRKLLIDDYQTANRTILEKLAAGGHNVVGGLKKLTGAQSIDSLINMSHGARDVLSLIYGIREQHRIINEEATSFEVEFTRLRKTATEELTRCIEKEMDPIKTMCHKTVQMLESLQSSQFRLKSNLLPNTTDASLQKIIDSNISDILDETNTQFIAMESMLQIAINRKIFEIENLLKRIGDDLFVVAETISTQIRQVNFDSLYNIVLYTTDPSQSRISVFLKYGWYVSLAVTALFVFIAFCFFFGLIYGICGRRPTIYNDDCCVRSTGGKFFSCGISMTLMFFTVLAVLTSVLIFVVGNSSNIVCESLRDPLSRPDIISLAERYLDKLKANEEVSEKYNFLWKSRTPADVIRACHRNETFYHIFEFDKKYHLGQLKSFVAESYSELNKFLKDTVSEIPIIPPIHVLIGEEEANSLMELENINITSISNHGISFIKGVILELNILSKVRQFEAGFDNSSGRPRAVSSVLEQLEEIDVRMARPLRSQLDLLVKNMTAVNDKLATLQVPISSLVGKVQHAQALLAEDIQSYLTIAATEEFNKTVSMVDQYISHVKTQMESDVSSCAPILSFAHSASEAICSQTIDPLSGTWMAMLISLACLVFIVFLSTTLVNLYNRMHSFPKYLVEAPHESHHLSSFITDTYDTRQKPGYANYSYTDDYHRTYR